MSVKVLKVSQVKAEKVLGGPIKRLITPETGSKKVILALGLFDPGEGLKPHIHPESEEIYYVIKGKGTVYAGEKRLKVPIEPETALYVPPGTIHYVTNDGKERLEIAFFVSPGTEPTKEVGS